MKKLKDFKMWFKMFPPLAETAEGWDTFDKKSKKLYPIRYWLNETLIPNTIDPILKFFKEIRNQIRYRITERLHIIDTKLKPAYYDSDYRILYGMFSILVDFVEIEKAWMQVITDEEYKRTWYSKFKRFRDSELGLKYLDWEITLKDDDGNSTQQAKAAKIIKELYLWWVDERQNRIDPYSLMDELDFKGKNFSDFLNDKNPLKHEIYKQIDKLEEEQLQEDTDKLIELIKVRHSLWT